MEKYLFLITLGALLFVFVVFSFNSKLQLSGKIKFMLPAIIISGALFIMFEHRFVEFGVFNYNNRFLAGRYYLSIPVEAWLYYLVLPLACFLIYETVKQVQQIKGNPNYFVLLSLFLMAVFALVTYLNRKLIFTFVIFMFLTVYFIYVIFRGRFKKHYIPFYSAFLFSLVPFFILQAVMSGLPVITYNPRYLIGFGLFHIPLENIAAFFLLFLMNISIYEYLRDKNFY